MARLELSNEALAEWEKTIEPQKFLDERYVSAVKTFFSEYDSGDEQRKRELITMIVDTFSKGLKVDCNLIIPKEKMSGTAGSYDRFSKNLKVFIKNSSDNYEFSAKVLTTTLHELRHAYQNQHMEEEDSELGRHIKYYTDHYSRPSDSNFIQEVGYKTNFIEIDAQRFAFAVAKAVTEKIIENSQNENRFKRRILEVKYRNVIAEANIFEKELAKNNQVVSNFESMIDYLKEHYKTQVSSFYTTKFDSKEDEQLQAQLIADSIYEFFVSKDLKNINNISNGEIAAFYIELLSSIKPEDLVSKLNNPLTMFLKNAPGLFGNRSSLSKVYGNDLIIYKNYIEKLSESVEFGKVFLDKFNIGYNKKDGKDIYLKYAKYSFEYMTKLFGSQVVDDFDRMLTSNVSSLQTRDRVNFNRQKLIGKIEKSYSEKDIKNILMVNEDSGKDNPVIREFQLNKGLLNGYGACYLTEKTFGFYSKFLAHRNISFDSNNFEDIFEKFNKNYPIFFAECINKPELDMEDENFIYNSSIFLSNNNNLLQKFVSEIKKHYSKAQIKDFFGKNKNEIIHILEERDVDFETVFAPQSEGESLGPTK